MLISLMVNDRNKKTIIFVKDRSVAVFLHQYIENYVRDTRTKGISATYVMGSRGSSMVNKAAKSVSMKNSSLKLRELLQ